MLNIIFFHDFYNDGEGIMANNCYHETFQVSNTDLESLLNFLEEKDCFTGEVKDLLTKVRQEPNKIFYDGEVLDIRVDGDIYPILMISEA